MEKSDWTLPMQKEDTMNGLLKPLSIEGGVTESRA